MKGHIRRATQQGFAPISAATRWVEEAAKRFAGLDSKTSKGKLLAALKMGARGFDISTREVELMDHLFAFSKAQDWEPGRQPIVWPSNEALARSMCLQVRQVQYLLRALEEHRLIHRNRGGRRWGRRDSDGYIIESEGINLSPLFDRYWDLKAASERLQEEARTMRSLRRQLTIERRRAINMATLAAEQGLEGTDWAQACLEAERYPYLARAATTVPELAALLDRLTSFVTDLEAVYDEAIGNAFEMPETHENAPRGAADCTSYTTTNKLLSLKENYVAQKPGLSSTQCSQGGPLPVHSPSPPLAPDVSRSLLKKQLIAHKLTPQFLCDVSPSMAVWLSDQLNNWENVLKIGGWGLRRALGISANAWRDAETAMGPLGAVAAACIIDGKGKDVRSPGGYFRAMTRKAETGQLRLGPSLHGLRERHQRAELR